MKTIFTLLSFPFLLLAMAGCFGGGKTKADVEAQHIKVRNLSNDVENLKTRVAEIENGGGSGGGAVDDRLQLIEDNIGNADFIITGLQEQMTGLITQVNNLQAQLGASGAGTAPSPALAAGNPLSFPTAPAAATSPLPGVPSFPATSPAPSALPTIPSAAPSLPSPATGPVPLIPSPVPTAPPVATPAPIPAAPAVPPATAPASPLALPGLPVAAPAPDVPDSWYNCLIVQHYRSQYPQDQRPNKEIVLRIGMDYDKKGNLPTLYAADPQFRERYERARQP